MADREGALTSDSTEHFWGEIAPCDHSVQIYEEDDTFFAALTSFVAEGIQGGEGVIVILTPDHLKILESRLASKSIDIAAAQRTGQLTACEVNETLEKFLVNDWPDKELFEQTIMEILIKARGKKPGRRVRAFGEIVAVMWERGLNGATVNLEHLWHSFCQSQDFALFCAYPKAGFTEEATESIRSICETHTRVIGDIPVPKLLQTETHTKNALRQ